MDRSRATTSRGEVRPFAFRHLALAAGAALALGGAALADTQEFQLSLDQVVSNGNPAPGAGNIEGNGAVDVYTFSAEAGTTVYFNEIITNNCGVTWTLKDASRRVIFSEQLGQCGPDAGNYVLAGGRYTLTVQIPGGVGSALYSFVLVTDASAQHFEIDLDQFVSNGNPAGAGNLEFPGAVDIYTFEAAPDTEVFFNEVLTTNCSFNWSLRDEADQVIFSQPFGQCGPDAGVYVLDGGAYSIRVEDLSGNGIGTYSFVLNTQASVQHFDIQLDATVSNGVPVAGAGNIEMPGAVDSYTFNAAPGTEVFFNEVLTTNCSFNWSLRDEADQVIFSQPFGQCGPDAGVYVLDGGAYTIRVEDPSGNGIGTYSFALNTQASVQHFDIQLNSTVSNGVPAAGAGNIESRGAVDMYTFTAEPGTEVFFNEVLTTNCSFNWSLRDEADQVIFSQPFGQCGPDAGTLVLAGGTYTLRVEDPSGNGTGTYTFSLITPASWQYFDLLYGQPVMNGVPAPGAGNIEMYGAVDIYTFTAEAGDVVFFNEILTTSCNVTWTVTDPADQVLFSQQLGQCGPDAGVFVLDAGTYTIRVEDPTGNQLATYSFAICSVYSPDINCDGHVNAADLGILLGAWGSSGPAGDLDRSGGVGSADLAILLGAWTG